MARELASGCGRRVNEFDMQTEARQKQREKNSFTVCVINFRFSSYFPPCQMVFFISICDVVKRTRENPKKNLKFFSLNLKFIFKN